MTIIACAYLTEVYPDQETGAPKLNQVKVTDQVIHGESFAEFVPDFLARCAYPKPQGSKFETYGFVPTLFEEGWRTAKRAGATPKWGTWRLGELAAEVLTLLVLDCDNQRDDQPYVTIGQIAETLTFLNLSHLLYTSFSHTDAKHKVRIVLPVSRDITYDEAAKLFTWFNHLFGYQLDGSIYSPADYLYGPTFGGDVRHKLDGDAVDVEAFLAEADTIPEEAKAMAPTPKTVRQKLEAFTPEELQTIEHQLADDTCKGAVSIDNPAYFHPLWLEEADRLYMDGSHYRTMLGLLGKAWLKSDRTLTRGELAQLQAELDQRMGGYCSRKYGRHALSVMISDTMYFRGSGPSRPTATRQLKPGQAYNLYLKKRFSR